MNNRYANIAKKMHTTDVERSPLSEWSRTSVTIRPEVLKMIDELAREDDRSRSRTISKLLETHPAIKKLKQANGGAQ